ncbi:hypothetical protein CW751_06835 [Brumimicrobium salinarum]|uniref:Uncharacterized protein n=2 Tax=Brumimicrobium salinarum TaxID=2058658 RepID=A0A2I0R2T7_9FLAO|nr:hypothetical protein CW751_06835 [Brumimicrobium salinarum]
MFFLVPVICFSQTDRYSYGFSGKIDSSFVEVLSSKVAQLEGVDQVKGRYKVEQSRGELLIFVEQPKTRYDRALFNSAKVKEILLQNNLTPLDFRKL